MSTTFLDVRLADDHEAARIPGSVGNAVFEVQFNSRVVEQLPDKATAITVYGANESSREADMAAEKLRRMGYQSVGVLEGGFAGWLGAGNEPETGTPLADAPPGPDGTHAIDVNESRVQWTGRNLLNNHVGTVAIESGRLEFKDGQLAGGEIILDLAKLTCTDLAGSEYHDVLIAHLHNDDFLDLENYPTARLEITGSESTPEDSPGAPNTLVQANLTLRGQTHPITFAAAAGLTPEGKAAAQATFSIDRTQWGVLYGSGKFFHRLAGHLVNDFVDFEVKIVTE